MLIAAGAHNINITNMQVVARTNFGVCVLDRIARNNINIGLPINNTIVNNDLWLAKWRHSPASALVAAEA